MIVTETMIHEDPAFASKTNSSSKSRCTIIPASPGYEAVSNLFPTDGLMKGIESQDAVMTQQPFEDLSTAGQSVDALWIAGSGSIPFGHGSQPFGKTQETIGYSPSYFEDLFPKSKTHSNQSNGGLQSASETGTPTTGKRVEDLKKTKADDPGSMTVHSSPSGVKMKRIDQYFFKKNDGQPGKGGATKKKTTKETKAAKRAEGATENVVDSTIVALTADVTQAKKRIEELELALTVEKKQNENLIEDMKSRENDRTEYQRLVDEMKQGAMEVQSHY